MAFTPARNPCSFNCFINCNRWRGGAAPGSSRSAIFSFIVEIETERTTPWLSLSCRSAGMIAWLSISFSKSISLVIKVHFVLIKTAKRYFKRSFNIPSVILCSFSWWIYASVPEPTATKPYWFFFALDASCLSKISKAFALTASVSFIFSPYLLPRI